MTALRRLSAVMLAAVLAACTGGEPEIVVDEPEATAVAAPDPDPEPTVPTTEPTTPPEPPASLPGEQIDFGPLAGDRVDVVGVPFDDVLNVRIGPGTEFDVIDQLAPNTTSVLATGANRLREDSFWIEVDLDGRTGWVSERFVGYLAAPDTEDGSVNGVRADMTVEELARSVAESFASEEPPSQITQVSAVLDGTVVFDVIGLGDDAVKGVRLTIETTPADGGRAFSVVERQPICGRGVTAEGLCI